MLTDLSKQLGIYTEDEKSRIMSAAKWACDQHRGQKRASGEPYIIHPISVAETLIKLKMDVPTVIGGLLHDVIEDTDITEEEFTELFGEEVTTLVNGVTKISIVNVQSKSIQESETIRKMFLAMVKDIRVILIKLADKKHNMGTLHYLRPDKQQRIAKECLDIYAPLAGKLGIYGLKSELEDASLKYLDKESYYKIKSFVSDKKKKRQQFLAKIEYNILEATKEQNITIDVKSRAKHFYSIYNKMVEKNKDLADIYDLLGLRILCSTTLECYNILGIVHSLWSPIAGRFKDYIAMPKENNYQSLHTTVMGEKGKTFEVQIRTFKMNQTAEYGIAAHWLYKEGKKDGHVKPSDLAVINKLKTWSDVNIDSVEYINTVIGDLLQDSIYVYTPKGDIIELPKGATALDFAYHIHSQIGDRCVGAKANNKIIALTKPLKSSQIISIMTSESAHPHVNWLKHVKTARAKSKIRNWLNAHHESVHAEKSVIVKASPSKIKEESEHFDTFIDTSVEHQEVTNSENNSIIIGNENNILVSFANCCHPVIGDKIVGFVSRGRGVIVHKKNCPNLSGINEFEERQISISWEAEKLNTVRKCRVTAKKTPGIFSEIEGSLKKYKAHLISGVLDENDRGMLEGNFTMELTNGEDFKKILKSIRTIPTIAYVQELK
ncbi:bifunctional (p)ppGpp synthetase/guanosine-3',5'-bis(diphosphate) 3'-pyrophosphohydrolase [Thiospirochaeta perfilievii]|uniref:Bifunctional (P)ppGpp synthetase/guanosine-3',5'-bis(Diphosphate) 3'-pyrophosphohydrolase n=1 Tax=Thiospirochaeta perfilievii TaxID=252967 RepID=A0A5C1QGZ1_9SPIO|nr:bifunctional (p)ppGpp synthetase/guanosine-3',5'-bis(diphosphate) 3'-pyrophosphohydrolase [Thiospirochaeta perfilievii]